MTQMYIPTQILPYRRCNRLVINTLWTYIVHLGRVLLAIITETIFSNFTNGCMTPSGAMFTKWRPFSPDCNPVHYNYVFLRILGSLKMCFFATLVLPTIWYLALIKHSDFSSSLNNLLSNSGSSYWDSMTCILDFCGATILIHNYGSVDVILITVENMSSNTTWYCGEIEPVNIFRTKPTCVELILLESIIPPLWLLGDHFRIFTPGFWKFVSKTNVGKIQTWQLLMMSDTDSNLDLGHISIADKQYRMSGIWLFIHIE